MNLLVANESDCRLFKFWFHNQLCEGISYQGELFRQFYRFSSRDRDQAHALGSKLLNCGVSAIICCSEQQYLVGINLRSDWSTLIKHEEPQIAGNVQELELALTQL